MGEILIVKKDKRRDKLKVKIVERKTNSWSPRKYEKVIANKDFNLLAYLLYDLDGMGYPISKAYHKFKELTNEPDLFFLK